MGSEMCIRDRVKQTIEAAQKTVPAIDADLVTRLEALQGEGSSALDLSDINRRLDEIESGLSKASPDPIEEKEALIGLLKADILADDDFLRGLTLPNDSGQNELGQNDLRNEPVMTKGAVIDSPPENNIQPIGAAPLFPKADILKALDLSLIHISEPTRPY